MLKKTKLRHSEYYDTQKIFDELYANSLNGNNFYKLMDLIGSNDNIRLAYRNIKTNKGSKTAGVDGLTIKDIQKLNDLKVIHEVQKRLENYQPKAVKRVFIPKEGTDKKRPLGIPTIWDRLVQQCILQILEPICEAKFHPHSYGFRPNRSGHHAFSRVVSLINIGKQYYCVDIDIKGFFDNVNHGKLLKQLWTLGIRDKALLCVISKLLKAEILGEGFPTKGTPQGGILSPLLSNIVLNELDWWVSNQWETYQPNNRNRKGFYQYARKYTKLKGGYIVRYADDFKIMCRSYKDAQRFYYATVDFLEKRLGLEVSPEKSKVVNLKKNASTFLGFKLKAVPQNKARNGMIAKTSMADKAKKRVQHTLKQRIKEIQRNPIAENVLRYNVTLVGMQNYYQYATTVYMIFTDIHYALFKATRARLSKYAKIIPFAHTNDTFRRKAKGIQANTKIYTVQGTPMLPTTCVHHKNPWNFSQDICNYTENGRAKVHREQKAIPHDVLQQVRRTFSKSRSIEYNDNRISKYIMQYGKCSVLKEDIAIDSVRCHHIVPIKCGGTDEFHNLVIVDERIHRLIHMTNPTKIHELMKRLSLNAKQLTKLNYLRTQANLEPINL
ncbi:group II intron reverse transcriptase/maturase [Lysinibacillus fusiformis]|uniref:group II intron reverse transcriptase/maturase n=1 Tax=Lysinibacillus fusiformis TaxID=28031 RepID=UPI003CFE1F0C